MNIILKGISKTFTQRTWRTILGLRKTGKVKALKNVSLSISSGEIFGLLGPNGAGKTTLIKILATLILPDSGAASVGDYDLVGQPEKVRHLIGFVNSNERSFYWRLTGRQNMHFFASLWNLRDPEKTRRIEMLFDLVGLRRKGGYVVYEVLQAGSSSAYPWPGRFLSDTQNPPDGRADPKSRPDGRI